MPECSVTLLSSEEVFNNDLHIAFAKSASIPPASWSVCQEVSSHIIHLDRSKED